MCKKNESASVEARCLKTENEWLSVDKSSEYFGVKSVTLLIAQMVISWRVYKFILPSCRS